MLSGVVNSVDLKILLYELSTPLYKVFRSFFHSIFISIASCCSDKHV